jgi:hypothetical protein
VDSAKRPQFVMASATVIQRRSGSTLTSIAAGNFVRKRGVIHDAERRAVDVRGCRDQVYGNSTTNTKSPEDPLPPGTQCRAAILLARRTSLSGLGDFDRFGCALRKDKLPEAKIRAFVTVFSKYCMQSGLPSRLRYCLVEE